MGERRGPPLALGVPTKRGRPPPPGSVASIADKLGNYGLLLLLFETPSGFAMLLSLDGVQLYLPDAMENIWSNFGTEYMARHVVWLKEFRNFNDKSSAIRSDTGVDRKLVKLIMRWRRPGQMLVVGKPEYRTIIETSMGIPCLFDETVMELMWGLQNVMHSLVPKEKSELTIEDRLPMSRGLKMFLDRKGFDVKPEMVNDRIVLSACALYNCDHIEQKHCTNLKRAGELLKEVSGIDTQDWSLQKVATALMIICWPEYETGLGDPEEMFTVDELSKFEDDAREYDGKFIKSRVMRMHYELVCAHEARASHQVLLDSLVTKAKEAYEEDHKTRAESLKPIA